MASLATDVAGYPKMSRLVGRILAVTDDDLPWWRVVNAADYGYPQKRRRVYLVGRRAFAPESNVWGAILAHLAQPSSRRFTKNSATTW